MASLFAQNDLKPTYSVSFAHETLESALFQLMDRGVPLLFRNDLLPEKEIHVRFEEATLEDILTYLLADTGLGSRRVDGWLLIEPLPREIVNPEPRYTLSGFITDDQNGERLAHASAYCPQAGVGTYSNEYGFFSLTLSPGRHDVRFSHLGYREQVFTVNLYRDTVVSLSLPPDLTLDEVVVTAGDSSLLRRARIFGAEEISPTEGAALPRLAGEMDLLRMVHLLPGVQTGADGMGGIFVRGGDAGHNLVLIDGVPVYNVHHAGGLLSVFNTSTVKSIRLLKGGFPARYGGRLSSVLDVRTREGNQKQWSGEASVGLLSSNLTLEGPLVTDKTTLLLSGRGSLLNLYLGPFMEQYKLNQGEQGGTEYGFYDVTAKLTHQFSAKDKLYLSYYQGSDDFRNFGETTTDFSLRTLSGGLLPFQRKQTYEESLQWGNRALALRWNHLVSPRLFLNATLTYSQMAADVAYDQQDTLHILGPQPFRSLQIEAGRFKTRVKDLGARLDFHWAPNAQHDIRFGGDLQWGQFNPGLLRFEQNTDDAQPDPTLKPRLYPTQAANVYLENTQQLGDSWWLNYGFHLSRFSTESTNYWSLQPRLSANWLVNERLMLRLAAGKNSQFVHLLTNNALGLPTDLWVPSTDEIPPQHAWQYSLGLDADLGKGWSFGAEAYYKDMQQLLSFSEGAGLVDAWADNVTSGSGTAYGLEVMLRRQAGSFRGWLSYSLAWANRRFDRINFGEVYPFTFDRRHDIKVVLLQELNEKWDFSISWLFGTGLAFSLPLEQISVSFPGVPDLPVVGYSYGGKNQLRMPAYHRLDLGVNYRLVSTNGLQHRFQLGIYNAYNRQNPLYFRLDSRIVVQDNQLREQRRFVGVEMLPILPSFSYSLKF